MTKVLFALALSLGSLLPLQAEARKCVAELYRRNGQYVAQFTNSRGCEEARAECLDYGRSYAPYGYCMDSRGTVVYVNGGGGGWPPPPRGPWSR